MNCHICGAWTEVVDSRKRNGTIRRRRLCANEHRFNTYEITEDDFKRLQTPNTMRIVIHNDRQCD